MRRFKLLALSSIVLAAGCSYVSAQSGGNSKSTATITQSGPGGTTSITRSGGNQTITRKSGGNSATISQGSSIDPSALARVAPAGRDADGAAAAIEDCYPAKPAAGAKADADAGKGADAKAGGKAEATAKAADCPPDAAAAKPAERPAADDKRSAAGSAREQGSQRAEAPGEKSAFERRIKRQTGIDIDPSPEFRELFLDRLE